MPGSKNSACGPTSPKTEYDRLQRISDEARVKSEQAASHSNNTSPMDVNLPLLTNLKAPKGLLDKNSSFFCAIIASNHGDRVLATPRFVAWKRVLSRLSNYAQYYDHPVHGSVARRRYKDRRF
jgi:hypothetical protein